MYKDAGPLFIITIIVLFIIPYILGWIVSKIFRLENKDTPYIWMVGFFAEIFLGLGIYVILTALHLTY